MKDKKPTSLREVMRAYNPGVIRINDFDNVAGKNFSTPIKNINTVPKMDEVMERRSGEYKKYINRDKDQKLIESLLDFSNPQAQ